MKVKKNIISKSVARVLADTLKASLHMEANSTSCMFVYQPKAPAELSRFTRKLKE